MGRNEDPAWVMAREQVIGDGSGAVYWQNGQGGGLEFHARAWSFWMGTKWKEVNDPFQ